MKRLIWLLSVAMLAPCPRTVLAKGQAEHVVVVVWDGMRPDFITPQHTPTLYALTQRGAFFLRNRCAYVSSTEVNGTVLATGAHPEHSGVMANTQYRPELSYQSSYGTENLDAVRRGDLLTDGHYLEAATIAEMLQNAGFLTIIAAAKPVGLLHDRGNHRTTEARKKSVARFRGQAIPRSALESMGRGFEVGSFPEGFAPAPMAPPSGGSATNAPTDRGFGGRGGGSSGGSSVDSWTTRALVRGSGAAMCPNTPSSG